MNFEPKFRIWDVHAKEFLGKGFAIGGNGKILRYGKELEDASHLIIHFSTGMLDKYNKEIYEEDIVEHTIAAQGELKQIIGIVRYDPSRALFMLSDGTNSPLGELFSLRKIGNPYENNVLYDLYVKNKNL
ncbi:MAG: hypothetical protein JJT78_16035 [Leptospira sp.]|nr:hypothetical protein [Leptospira sp.]